MSEEISEDERPMQRIRVVAGNSALQKQFCLSVLIIDRSYTTAISFIKIDEWKSWNGWKHKNSLQALRRIVALHGVIDVKVYAFDVTISIGGAFDWEDLQPRILQIIREELFDGQDFLRIQLQDRTKVEQ
jgi:hypothetical protein